VTGKFGESANWAKGINEKGQPVREPAKDIHPAGALVSPANGGETNWPPAAFSPQTGLAYVPAQDSYAMYYLTELDPRGAMGLSGKEEASLGTTRSYIAAIDYKTGKTAWRHVYPTLGGGLGSGMMTTAGTLLFAGDVDGNIVALRRYQRQSALASRGGRAGVECCRDVLARRPSVRAGCRRRHRVCVQVSLADGPHR
jgi:alcohol dehydrogenase (cytochrome c)